VKQILLNPNEILEPEKYWPGRGNAGLRSMHSQYGKDAILLQLDPSATFVEEPITTRIGDIASINLLRVSKRAPWNIHDILPLRPKYIITTSTMDVYNYYRPVRQIMLLP
jgi:hypothetical protein